MDVVLNSVKFVMAILIQHGIFVLVTNHEVIRMGGGGGGGGRAAFFVRGLPNHTSTVLPNTLSKLAVLEILKAILIDIPV